MAKRKAPVTPKKLIGTGPVRYCLTGDPNAPLSINIEFRLATPPEAYVFADSVTLKNDTELGVTSLLFGRRDPRQSKVSECVNVVIPSTSLFVQFLNSVPMVEETLDKSLKASGMKSAQREVPEDSQIRATLFANVVSMFSGNLDCALDFYYMPVRDIHLAKQFQSQIGLEPVLRVILPPALLKFMFELFRPFRQAQTASIIARNENRANTR